MEADWIEQFKCRRVKLKEMKEPERKGRERCSRAFDSTAGGKSAPARSVGSLVSSGARRRRLGGHEQGARKRKGERQLELARK